MCKLCVAVFNSMPFTLPYTVIAIKILEKARTHESAKTHVGNAFL